MTDSSLVWTLTRRHAELAALLAIILLAFALRLYELNADSLWGDEVFEAVKMEKGLAAALGREPLAIRLVAAYAFMQVGRQEFVFRFPYAIMGLLAVAAMYRAGRALFDGTTAVVGAFLLAISSLHIQYSQEARSYSLTVLLVLASLYCLYRALQGSRLVHWAGFAVATSLSLANHPTTAVAVACEIAWAILVLLGERFLRGAGQRGGLNRNRPTSHGWQDGLGAWWHGIRGSKGAMLALSSLAGVLPALALGEHWISFLETLGMRLGGTAGVGDFEATRFTGSYLGDIAGGFGAGGGVALLLFGIAFAAGLVCCAVERQWRQLLLAPIWMLPPLMIVPRITSAAPFMPRHLIFVLPVYLLFVARGISGLSELAGGYVGRSSRSRRLARVMTVALVLGIVSWLSVKPVQAYYKEQKTDWRGAAALLRERAETGDLVFQLMQWPREAMPHYLDGYSGSVGIEVVGYDILDELQPPVDVWWVLRTSRLPTELELDIGAEFDVYVLSHVAVIHRHTPIADPADFWQLTTRLMLLQAQYVAWQELDWYRERLAQAYDAPPQPGVPLPDCLPESSDLKDHVQTLGEQIRSGQRRKALDTLQKMRLLHDVVYPPGGELDRSAVRALRSLGGRALDSGDRSCALELYSRATDGLLAVVESDPGDLEGWRDLANVLVEAERYAEAIRAYERLIELAPEHSRYRLRLARAYRANGQGDEAIAVLEEAIGLAPSEPRLLLELGNTYLLLERMDEAVRAYQRALELDAGIVEAQYGLALAHDAQGETTRAIHEYQAVIEIDPEHWLAKQAAERLVELDE